MTNKIIGADEHGYYSDNGYVSDAEAAEQGFLTPHPDANKVFYIDKDNSDDEYLYVDVIGKGTVVIKKEDEGIVVDIFGIDSKVGDMSDAREPIASTWATNEELNEEEDA